MNNKQIKISIMMILAIIVALLYPPYKFIVPQSGQYITINMGYSWLFLPPKFSDTNIKASVDISMLVTEWIAIILIGIILIYMLKDKLPKDTALRNNFTAEDLLFINGISTDNKVEVDDDKNKLTIEEARKAIKQLKADGLNTEEAINELKRAGKQIKVSGKVFRDHFTFIE